MPTTDRIQPLRDALDHLDRIIEAAEAAKAEITDTLDEIEDDDSGEAHRQELAGYCDLDPMLDEIQGGYLDCQATLNA